MAFQQSGFPIKNRFDGIEVIPEVAKYIINVKDTYNLYSLYMMMHDWLLEEGWGTGPQGPTFREDYEFGEINYIQRDNPNFGKEVWLYWRVKKPSPSSGGGLFEFMMDLDFHFLGIKPGEINWKGQKVEVQKGEFEVTVTANIIIDPAGKWKKWPFSEIKSLLLNRVYRKQFSMNKKLLYNDAYRFRDFVMNFLKMETFMPIKERGEFYIKRSLD